MRRAVVIFFALMLSLSGCVDEGPVCPDDDETACTCDDGSEGELECSDGVADCICDGDETDE